MSGLSDWLKSIEPWNEDFSDVDSGLPDLDRPDMTEEVEGMRARTDREEAALPQNRSGIAQPRL